MDWAFQIRDSVSDHQADWIIRDHFRKMITEGTFESWRRLHGPRYASIVKALSTQSGVSAVILPDGSIASYLLHETSLTAGGRIARVLAFRTIPDQRRKGMGRCLMNHLLEKLRREGVIAVDVEASVRSLPARTLYETCGYQATSILYELRFLTNGIRSTRTSR